MELLAQMMRVKEVRTREAEVSVGVEGGEMSGSTCEENGGCTSGSLTPLLPMPSRVVDKDLAILFVWTKTVVPRLESALFLRRLLHQRKRGCGV